MRCKACDKILEDSELTKKVVLLKYYLGICIPHLQETHMEDMRGFICDNCDELILYREVDINDDEDICFECHENRAENEALQNYRRYT